MEKPSRIGMYHALFRCKNRLHCARYIIQRSYPALLPNILTLLNPKNLPQFYCFINHFRPTWYELKIFPKQDSWLVTFLQKTVHGSESINSNFLQIICSLMISHTVTLLSTLRLSFVNVKALIYVFTSSFYALRNWRYGCRARFIRTLLPVCWYQL